MTAAILREALGRICGERVIFGETTGELIRQLEQYHCPMECSCEVCRDMCKRAPCIGTPQDIMRLAQAGHIEHLMATDWGGMFEYGVPFIPMVQIRALEASEWKACGGGQCSLWNPETGLCTVHAIKPVEGRFAQHYNQMSFTSCTWVAALAWLLPSNRRLVRHLFSLVGVFPADEPQENSSVIALPGDVRSH